MVIIYHLTQHYVTEDLNLDALSTWVNLKSVEGISHNLLERLPKLENAVKIFTFKPKI
jgi:hypothetical protein